MDKRYLSNHLFLLVGGNPLPNAIAGKLLLAPEGSVTLVHSPDTVDVAKRLRAWLNKQGIASVDLANVEEEANSSSISRCVRSQIAKGKSQSLGLNYTGGTKAMSVHAYRAMERWAKENRVTPMFSYLDARNLRMVFDPVDPTSGAHGYSEYVGQAVELKLQELLELHGWALEQAPTTHPILPKIAQALMPIHAQKPAVTAWGEWLRTELFQKARRLEPMRISCPRSPDGQECVIGQPTRKWLSKGQLRRIELQWPSTTDLQAVAGVMRSELSQGDLLHLGTAAETCDYKDPEDFCKWLDGLWLESALLQVLHNCETANSLHNVSMNLKPRSNYANPASFEFDVVAIRGYQLFAFSCSTDTDSAQGGKDRLKKKLFEATTRARQLGGEEACVALVCCSDDSDKLQREAQDVFSEKADGHGARGSAHIKVFGRKHLADLTVHVEQWIQSQSGEE